MPATATQKLRIKEGFSLLTIHAPVDFQKQLQPLPDDVKISATAKKFNQVHWFVQNKAQLQKELSKARHRVRLLTQELVRQIELFGGRLASGHIEVGAPRLKGSVALFELAAHVAQAGSGQGSKFSHGAVA